jgi:hypothetical protein
LLANLRALENSNERETEHFDGDDGHCEINNIGHMTVRPHNPSCQHQHREFGQGSGYGKATLTCNVEYEASLEVMHLNVPNMSIPVVV